MQIRHPILLQQVRNSRPLVLNLRPSRCCKTTSPIRYCNLLTVTSVTPQKQRHDGSSGSEGHRLSTHSVDWSPYRISNNHHLLSQNICLSLQSHFRFVHATMPATPTLLHVYPKKLPLVNSAFDLPVNSVSLSTVQDTVFIDQSYVFFHVGYWYYLEEIGCFRV